MTEKKKEKDKPTEAVVIQETPKQASQVVHKSDIRMVPLTEVKKWYEEFVKFSKDILKKDLDYGVIPGTAKPTLLKPGAEKLRLVYGLGVEMACVNKTERMEDPAFIDYTYKATVTSKSGQILAESEGSCNSYEVKYKYIWPVKPKPSDEQAKKMKAEKKGRWRQTPKGAWVWQERTENPDIAGLKNTIMKMSQKRAMVSAILIATGASEFYTQDIEDMDMGQGDTKGPAAGDVTADKTVTKQPVQTTQQTAKNEDKKTDKVEDKKPVETAKATGTKAPESEKKDKIEDPINEVLGQSDAALVIREREVLQEWKEVVDKYTDHEALKKEAEQIVGGCMITGKIDTDKAQYLRTYINKKYKWLKAQVKK